jgi:hypothetical protein
LPQFGVLQLAIMQEPVAQVAVALVREQVFPQLPQSESVVNEVSQPLLRTPSQSSQSASHV